MEPLSRAHPLYSWQASLLTQEYQCTNFRPKGSHILNFGKTQYLITLNDFLPHFLLCWFSKSFGSVLWSLKAIWERNIRSSHRARSFSYSKILQLWNINMKPHLLCSVADWLKIRELGQTAPELARLEEQVVTAEHSTCSDRTCAPTHWLDNLASFVETPFESAFGDLVNGPLLLKGHRRWWRSYAGDSNPLHQNLLSYCRHDSSSDFHTEPICWTSTTGDIEK